MSRSGYTDDDEDGRLAMWRGAVRSAIRGARGQAMLRELLTALDAMPEKVLAADSLVDADGDFCTLGVLGNARGLPIKELDPEDWDAVAKAFGIAPAMAREIVYMNDEAEGGCHCIAGQWTYNPETPAQRWTRMRAWVAKSILPQPKESQHDH